MKLEEYRRQLQKDPDYLKAAAELKPLLDLADEILDLRLQKGWTQAELAERVGTQQANISRIENGLANPTVEFLQRLAKALGGELKIRLKPEQAIRQDRRAVSTVGVYASMMHESRSDDKNCQVTFESPEDQENDDS